MIRPLVIAGTTFVLLLSPGAGRTASAQSAALLDSLRPGLENAVVRAAWPELDAVIARLRSAVTATPADAALQYELGYALHRRASALLVEDGNARAKPLLEESERALRRAVELGGGSNASALALRGAVTGQLAGVSGAFAAMRLGPRAFRQLDEAVELAPDDPRVALLNGISRLNAPRAFGGGAAKGEPELRRAVRLFAADSARSPAPAWGRADAHLWLAIALDKLDRPTDARAEFERALVHAPGHVWITRDLLPALDVKLSKR